MHPYFHIFQINTLKEVLFTIILNIHVITVVQLSFLQKTIPIIKSTKAADYVRSFLLLEMHKIFNRSIPRQRQII